MIEKEVKSNNNIRTALLVVTISLFLVITTIFFISINYFEAIHQRITKLIELTNYKDSKYEDVVNDFLEAENHFRKYSIDLDIAHYKNYEKNINNLNNRISDIISQQKGDSTAKQAEVNDAILYKKYIQLQNDIKKLMALSVRIDSIQSLPLSTNHLPIPTARNLNLDIDKAPKTLQRPNKLPLPKAIKNTPQLIIDEETIRVHNKQLENFSKTTSNYFNEFRSSYESLRKSERKLLSNHFTLLYSIYQSIQGIYDYQIGNHKKLLRSEHDELLIQSSKLTWQTIICLVFIFILIFIMIYYQFRNRYYEKQLIQEQHYAAKLASEKSDILAEISHEIRTPLNSLIGIIDLLRKRGNIYSEKEQLFLDSAYSNITNTSRSINDILNLSKIDYTSNLDLHDFDINDLAKDIYHIHKSQAEIKNIDFEVTVDERAPTIIYSDELKIRQVLTNLISNGIKYTIKGKVSCYIKINEINNLQIKISDSGLGIPEGMQPHIFKKYFTRSDENKLSNGIGLGLYITKKLVSKLQGTISFVSRENIGTTFTIEIPIPKAKMKVKSSSNLKSLADFPDDLSWLLVDDNILNILYLKQFFQTFMHVKTASNGLEALEILKDYTPNIIITDINMPIMTGDELLVYIRQLPKLKLTKIIATSSDYEQIKELEKKRNEFFDNVIMKPFSEKDLVKIINHTLAQENTNL
jgi:signal transduction histidine kinase/CheY-like chemotaxis protein